MNDLVAGCLASNGQLTPEQHRLLTASVAALMWRVRPETWYDDSRAYVHAWELLQVARLVEMASSPT